MDLRADVDMDSRNLLGWRTSVTIVAASIFSGDERLDNHVRGPDFLDAERYPTIEFRSSRVEVLPGGAEQVPDQKEPGVVSWEPHADHLQISGDLTLHGITRPTQLDTWYFGQATDVRGQTFRSFSAHTSVRRSDFNIHTAPLIDPQRSVTGEVVNLTIEVIARQIA
jgi:polyisoprenoid-binding protein YceI